MNCERCKVIIGYDAFVCEGRCERRLCIDCVNDESVCEDCNLIRIKNDIESKKPKCTIVGCPNRYQEVVTCSSQGDDLSYKYIGLRVCGARITKCELHTIRCIKCMKQLCENCKKIGGMCWQCGNYCVGCEKYVADAPCKCVDCGNPICTSCKLKGDDISYGYHNYVCGHSYIMYCEICGPKSRLTFRTPHLWCSYEGCDKSCCEFCQFFDDQGDRINSCHQHVCVCDVCEGYYPHQLRKKIKFKDKTHYDVCFRCYDTFKAIVITLLLCKKRLTHFKALSSDVCDMIFKKLIN